MDDARRENRRLWNEWSDAFQSLWNANTADGELPPIPSPFAPDAPGADEQDVLETVAGKDYVELGCGGGQGTVGTAEMGTATAVGVDFSSEQLRHARRLRDFYGVDAEFVKGDVTALPLPDDRFDIASSEAVFQMIDDLDAALRETHRVLRQGGVFVLSVPHPTNEILDAESGAIEGDYFDTGPREIEIDEGYASNMVVFDRPVADLHDALEDNDFDVRRMVEHQRYEVREHDPAESDLPDVLWKVPHSVRFWTIAR